MRFEIQDFKNSEFRRILREAATAKNRQKPLITANYQDMLQEGLYALLAGSSGVQTLLGAPDARSDSTTGIFAAQMPEATPMPAIVYTTVAGAGYSTMDGATDLQSARLQFSCYGVSYSAAKQLASAVRAVLEGLKATLTDGTQVDFATRVLESDTFEEAPFIYHCPLDFEFMFREPA